MSAFRKDPIIDRWIIVTQNRLPINIKKTTKKNENSNYDKNCPFCEGNEINTPTEITAYTLDKNFYRKQNEKGWDLRIVPDKNVFLRIEEKLNKKGEGIYDKISGLGAHEIIIETPHHLNNLLDLE